MRLQRSLECCAWISAGFTGQGYLWRYLQLPSPLGQLGTLQAFNFGGGPVDPFLPQRDPISASTPAHGQTSSPSLFLMLPNPSQAYHVPISLSFAPSTHHHQMTKTQAAREKESSQHCDTCKYGQIFRDRQNPAAAKASAGGWLVIDV
ncbi:uncharacterized protein LOC116264844 isoform X2 [Nymphaea colorata]|nr:uncharacterized protein LOC116264844 isoform X2 [Nymphaea colorata]